MVTWIVIVLLYYHNLQKTNSDITYIHKLRLKAAHLQVSISDTLEPNMTH